MIKSRLSKDNSFKKAIQDNNIAYYDWYTKIYDIALGSWLYDFPKDSNIDPRWMEKRLLRKGSVAFFIDPVLNQSMIMDWSLAGEYDNYQNPNRITVYSPYVSYTRVLDKDEFVIIWDNLARESLDKYITRSAYRLYDLDETADSNARVQRTPILIKTTEEKRLSNKNLLGKYLNNESVIEVSSDTFNDSDYTVLDLSAGGRNFKSLEIKDYQTSLYNEILARLGVQSSIALKRERMVENEVEQLRNYALANRRSRILARKQAFESIKKKFGFDINFEFFEGFEVGTSDVSGKKSEFEEKFNE